MLKKIIIAGLILIIIGCKKESLEDSNIQKSETKSILVTVVTAQSSEFKEYGEYYGKIQGIKQAEILNILGGTVESIAVKEGSAVVIGDSLANISSEKAAIALESAQLNEKIKEENYTTLKNFLRTGNSSQINVDTAHLNWLSAKSQLLDAQKAYNGAFCITPISGTVVNRNIDLEDEVFQGKNTFLVEDLSSVEIKIGIPEADMKGIEEGNLAEISLDLIPDRIWNGTLTRFSRKSSESNLTFAATIVVDNKDGAILSGTTAKVKLLRNDYKNNIILPSNVILSHNNNNYVMVVKNNVVSKTKVILGPVSINKSVILNGVTSGDVVVQEGLHLLVDNQKVEIAEQGV